VTDFDTIASAAWQATETPLERLWVNLYNHPEPPPPHTRLRVKDGRTGLWAVCGICNQVDQWTPENDPVTVFVCEHEPVWVGRGWIRQIDTIALRWVEEVEEIE
jgi:hypothetical protein